ncbi:Phosphatidylethanolamine-binding protein [Musa troglodytarum]|uniref:Phosphatidylethanolamine-binding protein n=1 Tax=Musa troglodytarum TaxID=320322 RepID=A0A9E7EY36_9LILI|nr:Phosphatidylethanolamine-binding protein [Musa troglodytarum]
MSRDPLILGHVVGDVLDPFARSVSLGVTYKNRLVINGSEFKPSAVVDKPLVQVGGDDLRIFYTLVSSSSSHRLHPGSASNTLLNCDVGDTGREIVCYECPRPASGIHRVVLVLLRQIGRETVFTPEMRHNFSTRRFAMEHYLISKSNIENGRRRPRMSDALAGALE